jgi:hypothetical protein
MPRLMMSISHPFKMHHSFLGYGETLVNSRIIDHLLTPAGFLDRTQKK